MNEEAKRGWWAAGGLFAALTAGIFVHFAMALEVLGFMHAVRAYASLLFLSAFFGMMFTLPVLALIYLVIGILGLVTAILVGLRSRPDRR